MPVVCSNGSCVFGVEPGAAPPDAGHQPRGNQGHAPVVQQRARQRDGLDVRAVRGKGGHQRLAGEKGLDKVTDRKGYKYYMRGFQTCTCLW